MTVHLLLSAGRGPQECAWAVARLLRRMETDAGRRGVQIRRISSVAGERPDTFRSVLVMLTGDGAEDVAGAWTGTLCWQAPSPYRTSTGRKNWYVTARRVEVDVPRTVFTESDVDVVGCRTGGPGGQHRNKVSTAARATHRPSVIVVVVDTERQFGLNRSRAMELLRRRLEQRDDASERAADTARWHVHDELVRGAPVRVERPR
jgi:peptide chain release factor